jgi:DNA helicase-2/ATP-dependent DNA helicase PcrA
MLNDREKYFALGDIEYIWKKYPYVEKHLKLKRFNRKKLFEASDALKNLSFDYTTVTQESAFYAHCAYLENSGIYKWLELLGNEFRNAQLISSTEVLSPQLLFDRFIPFWAEMCGALALQNKLTFDDQKYLAWLDIRDNIAQGGTLSGAARNTHVFVDEFQDVSPLDLELIRCIADYSKAKLTLVGDDDQAVYEWRGASPAFIETPEKFFHRQFVSFTLSRNYRSPRNIVISSRNLIEHNVNRLQKQTEPVSQVNATIETISSADVASSIDMVVELIGAELSSESPRKLALVSRKKAQIIPYQILFASMGIRFCAAEDLSIFLSESFASLIEMIELKTRISDPSFKSTIVSDLVQLIDRINKYKLKPAERALINAHLSRNSNNLNSALDSLMSFEGTVGGKSGPDVYGTFALPLREFVNSKTVAETLEVVNNSFAGFSQDMGKAEDDIFFVDPPFLFLTSYADRYGSRFDKFLQDIKIAKETLAMVPPYDDDSPDVTHQRPVHLMTAIRSKGKEFGTVVVLDAVDGLWPHQKNCDTAYAVEQERRLFYVAITRAMERLVFTIPAQMGKSIAVPSRFLMEMGMNLK